MMDLGVTNKTGRPVSYQLADQYRKNGRMDKRAGKSFAELAAARTGKTAAQPDGAGMTEETGANGTGNVSYTGSYMGESYEERLRKITDKDAAAAFREAYVKKMTGSTDLVSAISKSYNTGLMGAMDFADAFPFYDVVTHVGNADISAANWQRNDFPFWEYFRKDTRADALNEWRPEGANPPQTRSDLQRNYSSIGPGRIAVLIPESLQQKMDADPAYAQQIMIKLQTWKEDYDRWDNTLAASYGYNVAEYQAGKSYVFDLDENGDVRNCTVTGSGRITGPTEEERRQFKAEQDRKRRLRVKYIQIQEESAERRRLQEQVEQRYFQSRLTLGNGAEVWK